jgi:predicted nucleic acid-binding protein
MGFLIDTNVLSELRKKDRADPGVMSWYAAVPGEQLATSVLVVGEIRNGIERLRRRDSVAATALENWLTSVQAAMAGRILPITCPIAERWGRLGVPDPLPVVDGLLVATALEHDLTLVTRNKRDVERTGVRVLSPFQG